MGRIGDAGFFGTGNDNYAIFGGYRFLCEGIYLRDRYGRNDRFAKVVSKLDARDGIARKKVIHVTVRKNRRLCLVAFLIAVLEPGQITFLLPFKFSRRKSKLFYPVVFVQKH